MIASGHERRVAALGEAWEVWAGLGRSLTEERWAAATRCTGWDVAAIYSHHSRFPLALSSTLPPPAPVPGRPLSALAVLRSYNRPGGGAEGSAAAVEAGAVDEAARVGRAELVERFGRLGPAAIARLRAADPRLVVAWPSVETGVHLGEAVRIVLMEATVHLLDVQRALGILPAVPEAAHGETARLLAELAPAVELIEAATGRARSPFPVVR